MGRKTLQEFVNEILGKYPYEVPISGFSKNIAYPEECVTLIKAYAHECFNTKFTQSSTFGNGKNVWSVNAVSEYCTKISASNISASGGYKPGDIISCSSSSAPAAGHVVIALNHASSTSNLLYIDQWRGGGNGRPHKTVGLSRTVYGLLRPKENLGNYTGGDNTTTTTPVNQYVTYNKWQGYGIIKKDYTNLMWYLNNTTTPSNWGFYGMEGARMDFLGKISSSYYYGWVNGICQSRILCVVPCQMVTNKTGKASGGTGKILVGVQYITNNSTNSNTG